MNLNNGQSSFWQSLLTQNKENLRNFERWIFHPGMLFNSWEQWWGDKRRRSAAHQGMDLCFYEDTAGQVLNVDLNLRIPAAFRGEIVKFEKDFLGQSIFLCHSLHTAYPRQLYTIYGHTQPFTALGVGKKVEAGELLAGLAGVPEDSRTLPHLHITLAWIPVSFNPEHLNWQNLSSDRSITLIDPLTVLGAPQRRWG